MTPVFEFTDRARPIVELGRSARHDTGNRWGEGTWSSGLWGLRDWEVIWTDLTCEIHQIDVDVGRGGATDRFVPGTATITASNVNQISEMIFPPVSDPEGWPFGLELVPQPPITQEEKLQAPTADTVVSNGWSFTDDFETAPPRWKFPNAWADTGSGAALCGPFRLIDDAFEVELYEDNTTHGYVGCNAAQWTTGYDPLGPSEIDIVLTNFDWPAAPTSGSPELRVDLFVRSNTHDRECNVVRFRFVPVFGGANQVYIEAWHMGPDGSKIAGTTMPTPFTAGTGTNGVFGTRTLSVRLDQLYTPDPDPVQSLLSFGLSGVADNLAWSTDEQVSGGRIGVWAYYVQGNLPVFPSPSGPRVTLITGLDFVDDLDRTPGPGWAYPKWARQNGVSPMIQADGALMPTQTFADQWGGNYSAQGIAQWTSDFDGDQYAEAEITNVSFGTPQHGPIPDQIIELYTQGNPNNPACIVLDLDYSMTWTEDETNIVWTVWQQGPFWQQYDLGDGSTGVLTVPGPFGSFPEPQRWRLESDLTGEQRIYHGGTLLATVTAPKPPVGPRIGVYVDSSHHAPDWPDANPTRRRQGVVRIESFSGGLQSPLGTEELGLWVRIGVHHSELGRQWLFRGFVDGVIPTYDPERPDKVRIECFDSLGEAGRVPVNGDDLPHPFTAAPDRIRQILTAASWPKHFRTIGDDATIMSRPSGIKAVDGLTQVAESCGGAVYGDPETGHVVFKGQDWQGPAAGAPPLAYITNHHPDFDALGIPRVCPSSWERTSQRQDMNTRVKFSTVTSQTDDGNPIVKEWRWPSAERLYGVEKYERTLICTDFLQVNELAFRQLRLRNPNQYPRVEAVVLDAATADETLDLMTTATFTIPSKYQCQHRIDDGFVFNRNMLVTGVSHQMTPEAWTCRLALDPSHVFADVGGRWDEARWGVDEWGRAR